MIFKNKALIIINLLITVSFIYGYLIGENSAGGGIGDYNHISKNYDLIFLNKLDEINWNLYDSSRYPFHYFFTKIYLPLDYNIIKLNNFILSFLVPILIFIAINKKNFFFQNKESFYAILSLSSLIFLSPYFRTSAFWMLEENFGIFFLTISVFFLYQSLNHKKNNFVFIFFNLLFIYFSYFSSQNLFFFVIINYYFYVSFFWKKKIQLFYITLLNLFFLVSPYFVFNNLFLEISNNVTSARLSFDHFKIVDIFSILLIYIMPIYLLNFKFIEIISFYKKHYILIILSFLIFILLNINYDQEFLGGGAIKKILFLILGNNLLYKLSLITFSFIGLVMFLKLSFFKDFKLLFFLPYFILLTFVDYVFQEYLDPIFLLFILFYTNLFYNIGKSNIYKIVVYFTILLIAANFYYLPN